MMFLVPYAGYDPADDFDTPASRDIRNAYREMHRKATRLERAKADRKRKREWLFHRRANNADLTRKNLGEAVDSAALWRAAPEKIGKLRFRRAVLLISAMHKVEPEEMVFIERLGIDALPAHRMLIVLMRRHGMTLEAIGASVRRNHSTIVTNLRKSKGKWRAWPC